MCKKAQSTQTKCSWASNAFPKATWAYIRGGGGDLKNVLQFRKIIVVIDYANAGNQGRLRHGLDGIILHVL